MCGRVQRFIVRLILAFLSKYHCFKLNAAEVSKVEFQQAIKGALNKAAG